MAALLASCPKLKIMATSRMRLHVRAEQEFAVPPLVLPDPTYVPDLDTLAHNEAVALFIQRAQAVKPDFSVSHTTAPSIIEICTRLDGLCMGAQRGEEPEAQ
jgi:predicted ATPase